MPICAGCNNNRELCDSHSIPDGFFRLISQTNSGKLISIPTGSGRIRYSKDTGKSQLLCRECETRFNREFDSPLVNAFKQWDHKIIERGFGVRFEFSPSHMAQALASIFWRAAVSGNAMYDGAKVSAQDTTMLRIIVDGPQEDTLKFCSCSISRIYDTLPEKEGGISQQAFSQIILPVNAYRPGWNGKASRKHFAFAVVIQGFRCFMTVPRLPYSKMSHPSYLNQNRLKIHAPPLYFLKYKPLADCFVAGMKKHIDGESNIKGSKPL